MTARKESKMTRYRPHEMHGLRATPRAEGTPTLSGFKTLVVAALASLAATGSVSALSCMRPTVENAYQLAAEREEGFVFAYGTLTRSGPDIPDPAGPAEEGGRTAYSFPARFDGHLATRRGFTAPAEVEVTVEVQCLSVWCGAEVLDDPALYALRVDDDRYALEATVCNDFAIRMPDAATLAALTDLLN